MKYKFFCIFILICFTISSKANNNEKLIVIKGNVSSRKLALEGVTVSIQAINKNTFTNIAGNFAITVPTIGKYLLHFSAIGFTNFEKEVQINNTDEEINVTIDLVQIKNDLEDVVVSGSLSIANKKSSTIPIEVYAAQYFKKNPTTNFFDALSLINGVQSQLNCNVCNTGEIRINGMDGPYTAVLIDGMPIVSSLATVYGLSGIPNNLINRVEIIKGPASTLFGSEAVGGLINIITKDPFSAEKLSVDISSTSLKEFNIDFGSTFHIKKSNALLGINFFWFNSKWDINNDNFTDVTLQKRISIFNKWNFQQKNKLPSQLAVRFSSENRNGGELNWNRSFKGSNIFYGENIYTKRAELISNHGFKMGAENFQFDVSYNYHHQDSYYGTTKYLAKQNTLFSQIRWHKKIKNHSILAGIPFKLIHYDDNTPVTEKADGSTLADILQTTSIFLQDEWSVNSSFKLLTGIRYENNNRHKGIFAPRLSVKYTLNNNHTIRFSAGNGFRIVNIFTEDHAALSGFREVVIKKELKPEKSWNVNLNYVGTFYINTTVLNIDATVFSTKFSNKIIPDYFTDPTKIFYDNISSAAISKGVSLNADAVFYNGLKLNVGTSFMHVYSNELDAIGNTFKNQQVYAPNFTMSYGMSFFWKRANLNFDVTGKTTGSQRMPIVPNDFRDEYSPSFNITNLQITKKLKHNKELFFSVKNIFNFIPNNVILHSDDPFNKFGGKYFDDLGNPRITTNPNHFTFDPTYNYAPMQGIKLLMGYRWHID